jgi:hypothetical protein
MPQDFEQTVICQMISLYNEGKSTREIGILFGTNHRKTQLLLKGAGLKLRDRRTALQKYVRYNTCVVCGTRFRPKESWRSTNGHNRMTCSAVCKYINDSITHRHDVGHSQCYYQKRRREFYPDICMDCGATDIRMDTHHIDRDKTNNSKENLMCLCLKCHAKRHYLEDSIHGRFERPIAGLN